VTQSVVKPATLGALLAWFVVAGCTGERDRIDDGLGDQPPGTADALVEIPPAPLLTAGRSDQLAPVAGLSLGPWQWAAPCRVVAHETIGTGGPPVERTFTIDIAANPAADGFVMSFDDVTERAGGLTEGELADALYRNLAVLSPMELDPQGRFVAFPRLDADLTALARRAGVVSADEAAVLLARQPVVSSTILDRTVLAWYGFWLEYEVLPVNPERLAGESRRSGPSGPWSWSTETYAAPVVRNRNRQESDDVVWLIHAERRVDSGAARIDAGAIVDPNDRRPSYVVVSIDGFTAGRLTTFAEQDRRIVTFDWENAEGCE
jgi:hypothetical protein